MVEFTKITSRPRSSGPLLQPPCLAIQYWSSIQLLNWNNNNIKIAHLNVRSLKNRGHFVQVKDIVTSHNFDVFTISETLLDHTVSNLEIEIPGYDIYRIDRQGKRSRGVCAYVRQIFKTEVWTPSTLGKDTSTKFKVFSCLHDLPASWNVNYIARH